MNVSSEPPSERAASSGLTDLTPSQVEVLKLVYEQQSAALRFETEMAYRIMAGFVTLELALAAWLAANPPASFWRGFGVFLLNGLLGITAWLLIDRNYARRFDIIGTLDNVNEALGLYATDAYPSGKRIEVERASGSWQGPFRALIVFFCLLQWLPIFGALRAAMG